MSLTDLPPPPRISVDGAGHEDIEAVVTHLEQITSMFKSEFIGTADKYRTAILNALTNYNENSPHLVRPSGFKFALGSCLADFLAAINSINSEIAADVRSGLDDQRKQSNDLAI